MDQQACVVRCEAGFNEIARGAMKSSFHSDEICFADEIKSVLAPDGVGFHHEVICSVRKDGFS